MKITPEKTKALIIAPANSDKTNAKITIKGKELEIVKEKKLLGVTIDDELKFDRHIAARKSQAFKALKGIDYLISGNAGCTQDVFLRLYKTLVLPVMDYGIASIAAATDLACKEFGQVQRSALLKATGCLPNVSLESMEVLSNCNPLFLHLKLRQAEELVRIYSKNNEIPIRKEFNDSMNNNHMKGKKPHIICYCQHLMS